MFIANTDTVPGIFAHLQDYESIRAIYKVKLRDRNKPLSIYFCSLEQMRSFIEIDSRSERFIGKLIPGPYTFIVKFKSLIPLDNSLHLNDKVGMRFPNSKHLLKYIELNGPICGTSANISNSPPICKAVAAANDLGVRYLDMPVESTYDLESTIIDITNMNIVRAGAGISTIYDAIQRTEGPS